MTAVISETRVTSHALRDLLARRVFQIAADYEDDASLSNSECLK